MAKQLGQIHTVNRSLSIDDGYTGRPFIVDMSQELTSQLSHMVRSGCSYKLVGIDMALKGFDLESPPEHGGQVTGRIAFYSPTRGRVAAWKSAYYAVRKAMKLNGINRTNKLYDFRVPMMPTGEYENGNSMVNIASPDGTFSQFVLVNGDPAGDKDVFDTWNRGLAPVAVDTNFTEGFGLFANADSGSPSDYVVNENLYWDGNEMEADTQMEYIPFTLSWTPETTDMAINFEWRPDPALYQAIMLGQFSIYIDQYDFDSSNPPPHLLTIQCAFHVAGWKSLLGGKKRGKRKSRSKKRRRK